MKPVHLFWTPKNHRLSSLQMGWLDLRYHLFSWVLSASTIRRFYDRLELVTDDFGEEILVNELKLPYTHVRKDYEGLDLGYPESIWAAKKMYGYTLHNEPFINIDGDAFIWQAFPDDLLNAPLFAQNLEINVPFYLSALQDIRRHFDYQPDFVKQANPAKTPIIASNAGILGANSLSFIQQYVQFGFDFLDKNLRRIEKVNKSNQNIIIEQYFFFELARQQGITIRHLIDEPTTSHQLPHMTHFTALPGRCSYIHIMGGKKYPTTCEQLEQRVRIAYPEAYYRVLNLIHKHGANTGAFFFSRESEKQALDNEKATSLLAFNDPNWENNYYRSIEILEALKLKKKLINPLHSPESFFEQVHNLIQTTPNLSTKAGLVLNEVASFENDRYNWLKNLPSAKHLEALKRDNAETIDKIMNLPCEHRNSYPIELNPDVFIWDSEWNWAEKKEFKQQVENTNSFRSNLKVEPTYFRIVLFIYSQQNIVREYLADPLSILLIDVLEEGQKMTLGQVLNTAFIAAKKIKADIDSNYLDALLDKLTFLAYQGIINFHPQPEEVSLISDQNHTITCK